MKYKIHEIKAEEKLEDIAKKYGVSSEEIKKLNPNTRFFKSLWGVEMVECLQNIKIPIINLSGLENDEFIPLFMKSTDDSFEYKIIQKQILKLNGQRLYETQTEMIWKLSNIEVSPKHFTLCVEQMEHKLVNVHSVVKELAQFAQLFNIPIAKLHLKFLTNGCFSSILNQEEIAQKWKELKENPKISELEDNSETRTIIKEGDKDFSDSKKMIENSFLYQLFFPNIYGNIRTAYITDIKPLICKSNIFQNQPIQLSVVRENHNISTNKIRIKFIVKNNIDSYTNKKLEKIYDQQFKAMVKEDFNYQFNFTSEYDVNKQNGIIQKASCELKEQLTDNFVHQANYTIQLLKNKDNE